MFQNRQSQKFSQNNSWLNIEISVRASDPVLLQGLDKLLQLNLITEAQVKKICQQNLSCALPEIPKIETASYIKQNKPEKSETKSVNVVEQPNIIIQLWQSFLDELSIRWLLFLGIFLVIVSSGVLAASQWNNFPRFGQYLILLIYTLVFSIFGIWSNQKDNLKLTSQTLIAIAILLVPINFWAISQFKLGSNVLEWITIIIAFITLTATVDLLFKLNYHKKTQSSLILFLVFSYLHLGWQLPLFSQIAIYSGIIALSLGHYLFLLPQKKYPAVNLLFLFAAWSLLLVRGLISTIYPENFTNYNLAIALFGWLLAAISLTIESKSKKIILKQQQQLTLTFLGKVFQIISIILLTGTWLISLYLGIIQSQLFFWQTVGISILTIHLFSQRLTLYWRKLDLTAIFLIGLQTLYIAKELIPFSFRREALNLAVTVTKTEYLPESVFGVTLFPYVILFVFVATWLYRRQKSDLALYAEWLTLLLGIGLTCLSLSNPTWRSLNLVFSTLTLAYVVKIRQPIRIDLIYITHLLGLVAISNGINVIFPNLNPVVWGSIFTLLTVIEWGIYLNFAKQPRIKFNSNFSTLCYQSCWYFGLLLGAISYACFFFQIKTNPSSIIFRWGLVWLCIPGMLTLVARYTRNIKQRRLATLLSCITLITAQLLVWVQPETRLISLAVAIGLMFINAYCLRRTIVTVIHLGFGLSLIPSVLYGYVTHWDWLIVAAMAILGLFGFSQYLQHTLDTPKLAYISQRNSYGILGVGTEETNFKLISKYIKAINYWAVALIVIEIALLTVIYLNTNQFTAYAQYLLTTILIITAIIWRYRKQPNNLVLYTLVWLIELLIGGLIVTNGGNSLSLAITNMILGILSLGLVNWQSKLLRRNDEINQVNRRITRTRKENQTYSWYSLNLTYIPLIYGTLAILWRLSYFNSYTGLLTIGAAIILINTNLNHSSTHPTTQYFAFTAISLGIYELVIYQMQLASGGNIADGLTILALVAAAVAFIYRLVAWRYSYKTTICHLSLSQFILIAHIHWAIGSILKILAAGIAITTTEPNLTLISIATSFCLGAYALIQGRDSLRKEDLDSDFSLSDWWVYVGLVEIAATVAYTRLIITRLSLFDPWRVVLTCAIAIIIYQIPWQNLGWRSTPWRHTAIVIPALMSLVTAEDISYLSLFFTTVFYLRIAYHQKNLRWTYLSLGFINWGIMRLVWQDNTDFIWLAATISLSVLYIAQFDPNIKSQRQQRHYVRLFGSSIICIATLFQQEIGIIPTVISLSLIFLGLGFKIRAFLFTGTITIILTTIYQLIILVLTYSFLKWVIGLLVGICSIVIAAGFEKQRERLTNQIQSQTKQLQNWQ